MMSISASETGPNKLKHVTTILKELQDDLKSGKLGNEEKRASLECLKIYGRSPQNADPIFTADGISTLAHQAFLKGSPISASREALSCIANSLLLKEETRKFLADLNLWGSLIERLKSPETHDEFLISRILLVETYPPAATDYEDVMKHHSLAKIVTEKLSQHASRYAKRTRTSPSHPMDDNALTETTKLIFNISCLNPQLASSFNPCIPHLFSILNQSNGSPSLQQPVTSVLNALLNLEATSPEWRKVVLVDKTGTGIVPNLVSMLSSAVNRFQDSELNNLAAPLVTLLTKIRESGSADVNAYLQKSLLPSDSDRNQVLGTGNSLPSRLLQLSASPAAPHLTELIPNLLFELSDSDAETFTRNVGLGFASGFLMRKGLLPEGQGAGSHAEDGSGAPINPITGQRLDREEPAELPPMTDEEKEMEAERLFVLFERLKRTGVVDVRNPVEDANRFEELPD